MLVLSRRRDESIVVNNDISVVVVEIREDRVLLGIEAPRDVLIRRGEFVETRQRAVEPAAAQHPPWPVCG